MLTKGVWKWDLIMVTWNVRTVLIPRKMQEISKEIMKIKRWMKKTKDREQWRLVVEEAKAHPGL
jgi:hypothetical protein